MSDSVRLAAKAVLLCLLSSCTWLGRRSDFDKILELESSERDLAITRLVPEERIELYLYEVEHGRPAEMSVLLAVTRSRTGFSEALAARLGSDHRNANELVLMTVVVLCGDARTTPDSADLAILRRPAREAAGRVTDTTRTRWLQSALDGNCAGARGLGVVKGEQTRS